MVSINRRRQIIRSVEYNTPMRATDYYSFQETKHYFDKDRVFSVDKFIEFIKKQEFNLKRVIRFCIKKQLPECAIKIITNRCFNHTFTIKDI